MYHHVETMNKMNVMGIHKEKDLASREMATDRVKGEILG